MAGSTFATAGRLGTAAAGGIIAGPIGFAVGSLVGSLLFGGGPDVEGPRLDDLDVSSSSYGTAIPRGYALAKITGTVIWATDIIERKSTEKHGGFFGIGGTKVTTYRYFANLAVAFGEGPATEIPRLWARDKLLRDRGYYDTSQGKLLGGKVAASPHHLAGLRLRSYLGTEDQEPDPLIARSVEDETGEADATPAHRGLVYVVLESLPLEDFGNRIPPVTAEVNWGGETQQPIEEVSLLQGQEITGLGGEAAFDWPRMRAFFGGGGGLRRIRLDAMREDLQEADVTTDGSGVKPYCVTRAGDVVCERETGSNTSAFLLVDGDTLKEKSRFGFSSAGLGHTLERFQNARALDCVSLYTAMGARRDYVLHAGVLGSIGIMEATLGQLVPLWTGSNPDSGLSPADPQTVVRGKSGLGGADAWWSGEGSGYIRLLRVHIAQASALVIQEDGSWDTWGISQQVLDIEPEDVHPSGTSIGVSGMAWIEDQGGVAVMASIGDVGEFVLLVTPEGLQQAIPIETIGILGNPYQASVSGSELALHHGGSVAIIDFATQRVVREESWPSKGSFGFGYYHGPPDSLFSTGTDVTFNRYFLRRSSNTVQLGDVVANLCTTAGLPASELDVAELTDQVRGFVLAKQTSYRKALELLAATYLFDVVESDFRLQFKKRGRPVTRVIHEDDLVPVGERETFVEERAQDVELPLRFSVVYRDVERDGDRGVQSVQRVSNPDATMQSRNEASLELPLALTPEEAKGIAQSLMFSAWIERTGQQLATTWTHVDLDPADVIQILRKSGELMTLRVNRLEIGGNLEIRLETVVEEASSYTSFAETDGGRLFRRFELPGSVESRLVLLDMPLISDEHDNGRKSLQPYWAAGGLGLGKWPGGSLYVSEDGVAFAFVDEALVGVAWGILIAEVGDIALPFQTDDQNIIQVFMTEGSLASVSELEMLQGANPAALVKASGEVEIIHFRDAVEDADIPGRYALSRLLRGRRGTETFTSGHMPGGLLILLDDETLGRMSLPISELSAIRTWKFVALGGVPADAGEVTQTLQGRDLKPFAPVQHAATGGPLGSADITLAWERRARILGELRDGTGTVPLSEDSEAYELEIRPQTDGPVLRTVTGLSTKSWVYALADHNADFVAFQDVALINPGAEDGDLSGWTEGHTSAWQADTEAGGGSVTPRSGSYLFRCGVAQSSRQLGQRVDVSGWSTAIDAGGAEARASAWITSSGSDNGRVTLDFLDADDVSLGTEQPAYTEVAASGIWQEVTAQAGIPAGTRTIVVYIDGQRDFVNIDTQFDDVSLAIKPGLTGSFAFTVYQMSGQVGRGFPGTGQVQP